MKSRRERRQEAKELGFPFSPQYNGDEPRSYEEVYGRKRKWSTNKYGTNKEVADE